MADTWFLFRNISNSTRVGIPLALLVASLYFFARIHITAPLTQDEVEYLHSAWLISTGMRPFTDFFQHHSPFFLWFISLFAQPDTDLSWVITLRMLSALNFSLALFLVLILARRLSPDSHDGTSKPIRVELSLWVLFVCTTSTLPLASFEIRAEQYALVCWLLAWISLCGRPSNRRARSEETIAIGLLAAAILLSPRTLPAALAILPFRTGLQPPVVLMNTVLRRSAILGLAIGAALWASDTSNDFFTWVIGFSRASGPPVSITDSVPGYLLIGLSLALLIFLLSLLAEWKRQEAAVKTSPIHWVVFATLLGALTEPRQFSQSLTFLVFALLIWATVTVLRISEPTAEVKSQNERQSLRKAASFIATLATVFLVMAGLTKHTSEGLPNHPLSQIAAADDLWQSVRVREMLCEWFRGETVLAEPSSLHPICLHDSSYFWRGSEYVLDGALERAGIHYPQFDLRLDIQHNRPALLALNAPLRALLLDSHRTWFVENYQPIKAYWVRRDLASELLVRESH